MSSSLEGHSVQVCHTEQKLRASSAYFEFLFPSTEIKFKVEGWQVGMMGKSVPQVEEAAAKSLPVHAQSSGTNINSSFVLNDSFGQANSSCNTWTVLVDFIITHCWMGHESVCSQKKRAW